MANLDKSLSKLLICFQIPECFDNEFRPPSLLWIDVMILHHKALGSTLNLHHHHFAKRA